MRTLLLFLTAIMLTFPPTAARAQDADGPMLIDESGGRPATRPAGAAVPPIAYEIERLPNGLTVIYAPMDNAPVVHLRVLYHVGSRDETPDRQGFAHMFEHMMFRGSEHVPSERHMELINGVGGSSNAFTSFDQTTYVNTVPSNALEMALWLEADRMGGFKVDADKFTTERNVVNEEYLQRVVAPPYGRLFMDFFALAYTASHYKWTPIGDMAQLREAQPEELQAFFDTYYVPNNAVVTIAGQFDVNEAKQWVREYYGWIEQGDEISRRSPTEPEQQERRHKVVYAANTPLPRITMGYKTTTYADADQEVLEVLGTILGGGRSSRLYQALVGGPDPIASNASAGSQRLEDTGMFLVSLGVLPGKDPDEAERRALEVVAKIVQVGVTPDELARAKTQLRLGLLGQRQTAESIATALAEAEAFGGDAKLVNDAVARLESITTDDVKRVAGKYLDERRLSVLQYRPGTEPIAPEVPPPREGVQSAPIAPREQAKKADSPQTSVSVPDRRNFRPNLPPSSIVAVNAGRARLPADPDAHLVLGLVPVGPESDPLVREAAGMAAAAPRAEQVVANFLALAGGPARSFPPDFPKDPPLPGDVVDAAFDMGESFTVGPIEVVVIRDERLPLVGMTLLLPAGGDGLPAEKVGLASLTADLLTRGAGGRSATEWNELLESRGINLNVSDGGDHTRLGGSFPSDQLDTTAGLVDDLLRRPNLSEEEFRNLKFRSLAGLRQALSNPNAVAGREMNAALFGDTPDGRSPDLQTLGNLKLDDARDWYAAVYNPPTATLILAGDVTRAQAEAFARVLTKDLKPGANVPPADYALPAAGRRIIVVDSKGGGQSAVRIGMRAFTNDSDEKYAGSVATEILSSGIESRLNRYLRAEKGLTYGASGQFNAGRHSGSFQVGFATKPESTGEAVTSAFEVLARMATEPVTDAELAEAKRRVTGSLVMSTQTVGQQAGLRSNLVLNGYPLDYYDRYAERIAAVTKEDVQRVMATYADQSKLTIVVVGPADVVAAQLKTIGDVEIVPMPLERK